MCASHWRSVPKALQRPVWSTYVPGQCDFNPRPSPAWHLAADRAIAYVAVKEGRWTAEQANKKLGSYGPRVWVGSPKGLRGDFAFTPVQRVYVGRDMPGQAGSLLGNPFSGAKEEAIARYRAWLQERMTPDDPVFLELRRLLALSLQGGVVLQCWCAPDLCHGDAIHDALLAMWEAGWRG